MRRSRNGARGGKPPPGARPALALCPIAVHHSAMTARTLLHATITALLVVLATLPARAAAGAALIAPMSGTFEALGRDMRDSAKAVLGDDLPVIDDRCEPEPAAAAARDTIVAGDRIVIGLPCIDAFDAAMPLLAEAAIPVLAVGVRAPDITTAPRDHDRPWPVFRVGPRTGDEVEALAAHVAANWREENFAVIDDGTLYGRELSQNIRLMLADRALEPVFVDTYRPLLENQTALVRRLQRSGATHVIIGGDARDAAVIAADAERIGYDLTLAGGSILIAPPDDGRLPDGTVIAAVPYDLDLTTMAARIAQQALASDLQVAEALRVLTFATAAGPLSFDATGEPDLDFVRIHTVRDGRPQPVSQNGDG